MLEIVVPAKEYYDESKEEFIYIREQTLILEHSLFAISKWEEKWHIPFLDAKERTKAQFVDYIRCMTLNKVSEPNVYFNLTNKNIEDISEYMKNPMTATWFPESKGKKGNLSGEKVTSELIYYWMFSLNIPKECEHWHINKLMTLVKVFNEKNKPQKKKSANEILREQHALNQARLHKPNIKK